MKIYSLRLLRASVLVCLKNSLIISDFFGRVLKVLEIFGSLMSLRENSKFHINYSLHSKNSFPLSVFTFPF